MKKIIQCIIIITVLITVFCKCYTDKKATKEVNKALLLKPTIVAKIARDAFPCVTLRADTAYNYYDTTIVVNCPEMEPVIPDTSKNVKQMFTGILPAMQVPFVIRIPGKVVTITKMDSAALRVLKIENDKLTIINLLQSVSIKRKNKWLLYLLLFVGFSVIALIYKFLIKFK